MKLQAKASTAATAAPDPASFAPMGEHNTEALHEIREGLFCGPPFGYVSHAGVSARAHAAPAGASRAQAGPYGVRQNVRI